MLRKLLLITLLISTGSLWAQSDLHIPSEFRQAYDKDTRSMDGKPGVNYWQNTVDYDIDVTITPETRGIEGKETVVYKNNSPDDLNTIVVRLYYDVFKKGNPRGMTVNPEDIDEGVEISQLSVNGQEYDLTQRQLVQRQGTNMYVRLMSPLSSGEEITLDMSWSTKVPLTVRRTGALDSTSFFIAYWYPQISVYDDVFGWDQINYTFDTEFYNNLADFDVEITAPDNFLVWATGTLENADEILPDAIHDKYQEARRSTDVINVVTAEDLESLRLKSGTWHYTAKEVTDFAIATSDHFLWDATSQEVDGRDVLISTAYPVSRAAEFGGVTKVQQKTMKAFSEDVPGVPYPYEAFTTFIGLRGGGMEFPMMANNDGPGTGVTIHEMFHTYFPMYVRINERRFAWMDEGWANFVTALVMHKHFSEEDDNSSFYSMVGLGGTAGSIGDLPTVTSSQYTGNNYGYQSYSLPSFTYALLYQHLGEERFLEAFRTYINRWAKKSPTPYDFFYTFEDVTGEDLSWLWNTWYFGFGYPDLAIESFKGNKLTVRRIGERPVPVSIQVEYEGEGLEKYSMMLSASSWKEGAETFTVEIPNSRDVKTITLNPDIPDVNEMDNFYPSLQERMKDVEIPEELYGSYSIQQYGINILLEEKDGLLAMSIPAMGSTAYVMPHEDGTYQSIDGSIILTIEKTDDAISSIDFNFKTYGLTLKGTKQ